MDPANTSSAFHATTIVAVRHLGQSAICGDGQVTFGQQMIMKTKARKIRRLYRGKVIVGFAGAVADAIALYEMFEAKLEEYQGQLQRAAVELAKAWRQDKMLRRLEAMMIAMDGQHLLLIAGTGEIIEPDDDVLAIGSGSVYALSAARALKLHASHLTAGQMAESAMQIAAGLCVYTNDQFVMESVSHESRDEREV
jgi:ATP-dependent HslUV protease subunit HslV